VEEIAPMLLRSVARRAGISAEGGEGAGELRPWIEAMAVLQSGGERLPVWVRNEMKTVETEVKYAGYLEQQRRSIQKMRGAEETKIPAWFDYETVSGLSREMQETLSRVRPVTLGQASRIQGVTPAAVSLIHVYIEIQRRKLAS
jgi:tRNA uridine 5-carboxymethylaminomethyl modification enzyme